MLNNPLRSRGGKAAMAVALDSPTTLSHLIVADIAPSKGPLSPDFISYTEAMQAIESAGVKTRKEALEILHEVEQVFRFLFHFLSDADEICRTQI
jgi:hypothetical protein